MLLVLLLSGGWEWGTRGGWCREGATTLPPVPPSSQPDFHPQNWLYKCLVPLFWDLMKVTQTKVLPPSCACLINIACVFTWLATSWPEKTVTQQMWPLWCSGEKITAICENHWKFYPSGYRKITAAVVYYRLSTSMAMYPSRTSKSDTLKWSLYPVKGLQNWLKVLTLEGQALSWCPAAVAYDL